MPLHRKPIGIVDENADKWREYRGIAANVGRRE